MPASTKTAGQLTDTAFTPTPNLGHGEARVSGAGRILATNAGYLRIVGTDDIVTRSAGWAWATSNFSHGTRSVTL